MSTEHSISASAPTPPVPANTVAGVPPQAREVFRGVIFTVYQWDQPLYDGTTAVFERITRADTVGILPVLPNGEILVCRQEQPAKPPFLGMLGGVVDPGESALAAAQRELLEESGYTAANEHWTHWKTLDYAGKIFWRTHFYIAHHCQKTAQQQLDGGEKIEIFSVPFDELLELTLDPEWRDQEFTHQLLRLKHSDASWDEFRQLMRVPTQPTTPGTPPVTPNTSPSTQPENTSNPV